MYTCDACVYTFRHNTTNTEETAQDNARTPTFMLAHVVSLPCAAVHAIVLRFPLALAPLANAHRTADRFVPPKSSSIRSTYCINVIHSVDRVQYISKVIDIC